MNFERTLNTLRDWQEENQGRCFVVMIADKDTNEVQAAAGGVAKTVAAGLAAMLGKLPHFDDVLQEALNLYAMRQNDKAVEKFVEEEESAEITEEVKAAQEGESYREEQETHGI